VFKCVEQRIRFYRASNFAKLGIFGVFSPKSPNPQISDAGDRILRKWFELSRIAWLRDKCYQECPLKSIIRRDGAVLVAFIQVLLRFLVQFYHGCKLHWQRQKSILSAAIVTKSARFIRLIIITVIVTVNIHTEP